MTRILLVASLVVILAFAGFSFYIDSLQRAALTKSVRETIESSGEQAADSISNWLNARVMLTEFAADVAGKAVSEADIVRGFDTPLLSREFGLVYFGSESDGSFAC
jgi:methyl-accepting chemotaxis protein